MTGRDEERPEMEQRTWDMVVVGRNQRLVEEIWSGDQACE